MKFETVKQLLSTDEQIKIPPENSEPEEIEELEPKEKKARKKRTTKNKDNNQSLANGIAAFHKILANVSKQPLIELQDEESEKMATAINEVLSHYDIAVNPLTAAYVNLAVTMGMIYAPRIYMYKLIQHQKQQEANERLREFRNPIIPENNEQPRQNEIYSQDLGDGGIFDDMFTEDELLK